MPKATVQAAIGGLALDRVGELGGARELQRGGPGAVKLQRSGVFSTGAQISALEPGEVGLPRKWQSFLVFRVWLRCKTQEEKGGKLSKDSGDPGFPGNGRVFGGLSFAVLPVKPKEKRGNVRKTLDYVVPGAKRRWRGGGWGWATGSGLVQGCLRVGQGKHWLSRFRLGCS